jgi:hypothetical protein
MGRARECCFGSFPEYDFDAISCSSPHLDFCEQMAVSPGNFWLLAKILSHYWNEKPCRTVVFGSDFWPEMFRPSESGTLPIGKAL